MPDPQGASGRAGQLAGLRGIPVLPGTCLRVPGLEGEAAARSQRRPDRGERGPQFLVGDQALEGETERVEVACAGGRGRTGTALACLAVLDGVPAALAVQFVRRNYEAHAVETPWQKRYVRRF
ncbi:hypothetical protein [Streptomyces sp. NBRC 13847]|uniref:protein-tyrosine phosphatase family protein n=1 Tax=Streptomyces sp. NBRC 13847 TaxID=3030991 RepID=UPI002553D858|nr:hypothetical protein [Streptomyces sp. NBRC 13847]